jgi:hypothetical protein
VAVYCQIPKGGHFHKRELSMISNGFERTALQDGNREHHPLHRKVGKNLSVGILEIEAGSLSD